MKKITTAILTLLCTTALFGAKATVVKTNVAEEGFQTYIVAEALKNLAQNL